MLIGIAGPKRSGKTTLATLLGAELSIPLHSFAEPIRLAVASLLGCTVKDLEGIKEEPIKWLGGRTARYLMQSLGTEWGRKMVHNDIWVRSLLHRLPADAIITDVRFEDEAQVIRARGGKIICVRRPGTGGSDLHLSERGLPARCVDYYVANTDTPRAMMLQVKAWLNHP